MKFEYDSELYCKHGWIRSAICTSHRSVKAVESLCDDLINDLKRVGLNHLAQRLEHIRSVNRTPVSNLEGLEKDLDKFVEMIPEAEVKNANESTR